MKDYLLLFRGGLNYSTATPEEVQQNMAKWKAWIDEIKNNGKYNGGNRLTKDGTIIKGSKKQVIDGPYTESKEIVGGYISITVESKEEATEIAQGCPIFIYDGDVEIREVAKM